MGSEVKIVSKTNNSMATNPLRSGLGISAVERDTGLSKDTLRVWERRYGFPRPGRDALGERLYPLEQVDRLRLIRRLMDAGHRPGKVVGLPVEELQALAERGPSATASVATGSGEHADLGRFLELTKSHRVEDLRRALSEAALRMGLDRFVADVVAPLNRLVGDAWACGDFEVFEEHLYTEAMQGVLRTAIGNIPPSSAPPRVLLTTFPSEPHGLGLLMAEALMALEGCRCLSLGVQTPVRDIALAAEAQDADVVALSFSGSLNTRQALEGLVELRKRLPAAVEIWVGGGCAALKRRPPAGVRVVGDLALIGSALSQWRDQRATSSRGDTNSVSTPV